MQSNKNMINEYIRTSVAYRIEKGLDAIKEAANTAPFLPMCIRQVNQVITIAKQPNKPEKALRIKSELPNKSIHNPKRR